MVYSKSVMNIWIVFLNSNVMVKCKNTALYFQTALEMIYIIFYLYWKNWKSVFRRNQIMTDLEKKPNGEDLKTG